MKKVTIKGGEKWVFTEIEEGQEFQVVHQKTGANAIFKVKILENENFVLVNDFIRINSNSQNYGCLKIQTGVLSQKDIINENYILKYLKNE